MYVVSEKTGIAAALLQHEKPLSVVLPEFLKWISITTKEVAEQAGASHYSGTISKTDFFTMSFFLSAVMVAHNGFKYDFSLLAEIMQTPKELNTANVISH